MLTPLSTGVDVAGFDCISFKYRYRYAESVQANDIYIGRWYVDRKAYGEISKKHRRQTPPGMPGTYPHQYFGWWGHQWECPHQYSGWQLM